MVVFPCGSLRAFPVQAATWLGALLVLQRRPTQSKHHGSVGSRSRYADLGPYDVLQFPSCPARV
jgi:hypothetical protein